jgi:hypothetical protein
MLVCLVVSIGFLWELGFERDMRIRCGQGRQPYMRLMRLCAIEGLRKILVDRLVNDRSNGLEETMVEFGGRWMVCCLFDKWMTRTC